MPFHYKPLVEILEARPGKTIADQSQSLLLSGRDLDPLVAQGKPLRLLDLTGGGFRDLWIAYLPPGSHVVEANPDAAPDASPAGPERSIASGYPDPGGSPPYDIIIIADGGSSKTDPRHSLDPYVAMLAPGGVCTVTRVQGGRVTRGAEEAAFQETRFGTVTNSVLSTGSDALPGEHAMESVAFRASAIVIRNAPAIAREDASDPRIAHLEAKLRDADQQVASAARKVAEVEAIERQQALEVSRLRLTAIKVSQELETAQERAAGFNAALDKATILQGEVDRSDQRNALLEHELAHLRSALELVQTSTFWRLTHPLRSAFQVMPASTKFWLRRSLKAGWWAATPWRMPKRIQYLRRRNEAPRDRQTLEGTGSARMLDTPYSLKRPESPYTRWVAAYDTLTNDDRRAIRARIVRLRSKPMISIVMPVYNTDPTYLSQAIQSVRAQLYPYWELCIADDASSDPAIKAALAEAAGADTRIKVVFREENGHISAASNSALAIATGEFVGLMDHDDTIPEHALFLVAAFLNEKPDCDLIFSDEDHLDEHEKRTSPYFKSDFNYELLLGHNMVNHFSLFRREILNKIGGFRIGYEGSQDYDLVLRFIDAIDHRRILHIPHILYHWRSTAVASTFSQDFAEQCIRSARRAIADHLIRRGVRAEVLPHPVVPSWHRVRRVRPDPAPLVSIIVPTKDKADILKPCCEGILHRTHYTNIELIIVDHQSSEPETIDLLEELSRDDRVRIVPYKGEFNYSAINNAAVATARGEILALVNNDIEVIDGEWLDEMVALAVQDDIGAVGAKLLYANNRVQHGGVLIGTGGVAGHLSHMLEPNDPGDMGRAVLTTAVSAVTGACLMIRTAIFRAVGGFDDKNLPIAFNDVDLCLKVREAGYRNVLAAHAILYHHESVSRGLDVSPAKAARFRKESIFMIEKWGDQLMTDPFYNPNLDLATAKHEPAFPPRHKRAWSAQA